MKNDSDIKNIIFDLGGVILNIDYKKTENAFEKLGIKNIKEVYGQYFQVDFFDKFDRGEINEEMFIEYAKELLPAKTNSKQIVDAWNAMLLELPKKRFELLKKLAKEYRIFLMSNTNITHFVEYQKYIKETYGIKDLDSLFEKAYYSFISKMRKPEERFFNLILQENNLKPNETLFIDDTSIHTDAAQKLGIKTINIKNGMDICDNGIFEKID